MAKPLGDILLLVDANDLLSCKEGDILRHASGEAYVCVGKTEMGFPIVVRQLIATNPREWVKVAEINTIQRGQKNGRTIKED